MLQNNAADERLGEAENSEVAEEFGPEDVNSQYNDNEEDDNIDGWVDERVELSQVEADELEESVLPVRLVLTKVRTMFIVFVIYVFDNQCYLSFAKPLLR